MSLILDALADNLKIDLAEGFTENYANREFLKHLEKLIKDQIRQGAFITEDQLQKFFNNLVIRNQPGLFEDKTSGKQ